MPRNAPKKLSTSKYAGFTSTFPASTFARSSRSFTRSTSLSVERIHDVIELTAEALQTMLGRPPRLGVCGLNPHAGERVALRLRLAQIARTQRAIGLNSHPGSAHARDSHHVVGAHLELVERIRDRLRDGGARLLGTLEVAGHHGRRSDPHLTHHTLRNVDAGVLPSLISLEVESSCRTESDEPCGHTDQERHDGQGAPAHKVQLAEWAGSNVRA